MEIVTFKHDSTCPNGVCKVVEDLYECPECGAIALEKKRSHDAHKLDKDICHECGYRDERIPTG